MLGSVESSARPLLGGVAAVCVLLLGTACGERHEPTGPSVPIYPVTVAEPAQSPLILQKRPQRVAVLAPGPARILTALGVRAESGLVAANGQILLPELRRLRPDLIVASALTDEVELARARRATHAPIYLAPANSIRGVERAITQLGLLTDRPVQARALVRRIEDRRRAVAARLAGVPRVSVFLDAGFFTTVSDRTLVGALLREAQGRNVAGPDLEQGSFPLRDLARLDPDVYLASSDGGATLAELRRRPETRRLRAVQERRVFRIGAGLLEPGPQIAAALETIARLLHPDAFR